MAIESWVNIDPETEMVTIIFRWDGETNISGIPSLSGRIEKYDPEVHPPFGYPVTVGAGWQDRYEAYLEAQNPAAQPADAQPAVTDTPQADPSVSDTPPADDSSAPVTNN